LPHKAHPIELLYALYYMHVYPTWTVGAKTADKATQTFIDSVQRMVFAISKLDFVSFFLALF